ncbi:MAG: UDP-N-acetylmuramate dehydrogenase [Rikenellaceae bacterium]
MFFLEENHSLLPLNTFGFEAIARYYATFECQEELENIIKFSKSNSLPFYVRGGGSNIIFSSNFDGIIIHPTCTSIEHCEGNIVAGAGLVWDDFVCWATKFGYSGIENLAYIPGTVGASPVQNIGAYGAQVSDTIEWVEYFDTQDMTLKRLTATECAFGYRDSIFKRELKGRAIITRVAFNLSKDFNPLTAKLDYGDLRDVVNGMEGGVTLKNIRRAVTQIRKSKLPEPSEIGNAGSFFKNPVISETLFNTIKDKYPNIPSYSAAGGIKIPAGWLIEQAGFKGTRRGNVGVHAHQALVLVHFGGGTATELMELAEDIIATIHKKFGVVIEREVNLL